MVLRMTSNMLKSAINSARAVNFMEANGQDAEGLLEFTEVDSDQINKAIEFLELSGTSPDEILNLVDELMKELSRGIK